MEYFLKVFNIIKLSFTLHNFHLLLTQSIKLIDKLVYLFGGIVLIAFFFPFVNHNLTQIIICFNDKIIVVETNEEIALPMLPKFRNLETGTIVYWLS